MSSSTAGAKTVLSVAGLSYSYSSRVSSIEPARPDAGMADQPAVAMASGWTIRNLGLTVDEGEIVCILGASGCGKSTLLNLIAGLLRPDIGQINITSDGQDRRRIGYIFQQDALLPWRTVEANVMLAVDLSSDIAISKDSARESVNQYLQTFNLDEKILKQYPAELSGGMRQRVSIIQSLMFNPKLFLLDEPFSALDFFTKLKLESEFYQLIKEKNKAAILVTHDIEESVAMADRVLLMGQDGAFTREFVIDLGEGKRSPDTARGTVRFADYYRDIWSELKAVIGQ